MPPPPKPTAVDTNWSFLEKFDSGAHDVTSGLYCSVKPGGQGWFRNTRQGPWDATTGCTDWQNTQWEASFKDVPFAVDNDTRSGGRRIHVHEFPNKEDWANEDIGRLRQTITVDGYVFGDKSDQWAEMLFAACTSPLSAKSTTGAGILYLPMRVPLWAVCMSVESSFNAEAMGRIDFSMSFSVEPREWESENRRHPSGRNPIQFAHAAQMAANQVVAKSLERFDHAFTGGQPSVARTTAAFYIQQTGKHLRKVGKAIRLNDRAAAVVEFIAQRFIENANAYADAQRTAVNTLNREAAVLSQRASRLSLYQQAMMGVAIRASTGEVLPATGKMGEGFGGMLWNAMAALQAGSPDTSDNSSDFAQALLPMTNMTPHIQRKLSAAQLRTASVQAELQLAETVCALVRRVALAYSIMAGIRVAPSKQPDASLTRKRVLQSIDDEIALLPAATSLQDALRLLRRSIVAFVDHYSVHGSASVKIPKSWVGKPLAVIAASVYGRNAAGRDVDLMRFNGVTHPMFSPSSMVALKSGSMLLTSEL